MRHRVPARPLLFGMVTLLAALVLLSQAAAKRKGQTFRRDFTISADPNVEVLRLMFIGFHTGERTIYSLYGDGRFRVERRARDGELRAEAETEYPYSEVERLVRIAVDHHLADVTKADLEPIVELGRGVTDLGWMIVHLRLESYARDGEALGKIDQRFRLPPARYMNHRYPSSDVMAGLAEIEQHFVAESRRLLMEPGGTQ